MISLKAFFLLLFETFDIFKCLIQIPKYFLIFSILNIFVIHKVYPSSIYLWDTNKQTNEQAKYAFILMKNWVNLARISLTPHISARFERGGECWMKDDPELPKKFVASISVFLENTYHLSQENNN